MCCFDLEIRENHLSRPDILVFLVEEENLRRKSIRIEACIHRLSRVILHPDFFSQKLRIPLPEGLYKSLVKNCPSSINSTYKIGSSDTQFFLDVHSSTKINLDRITIATMNPIVSCPYDGTHRVKQSKLPYHLTRCKRNNNSSTFNSKVSCPFNAFHVIEEETFKSHVDDCRSNGNVKSFLHNLEPQRNVGIVPLEATRDLKVGIMKDWEEEDVETYDPWKSTETKDIIRCISGGSKAQKRAFKLAERKRLESIRKKNKFQLQQRVSSVKNPLKEYTNISQLVRNLQRMSLENFDTLLESIDMSSLRISKINNFQQYKYISHLAEGMLTQKLKELVLYCMKKEAC
ncbi:uncharacterized protein LOC143361828 [Halictus rubicundus]|uniref:uncharacterized protein LOC143361828 n=1 Tax=Halictus rubicundus TaxID=77578 RepID=UPI0040352EDA